MQFSDADLHDSMAIALKALIDIINTSNDLTMKGNAAISLANVILEIWDRTHVGLLADDVLDVDEDDEYES